VADTGERTGRAAEPVVAPPADLMAVYPAVPTSLPRARAAVRDWLAGHGWPELDAEDVELAVHEAIANVVDHAYVPGTAGTAHLHAWVSPVAGAASRRVVVVVTDRGRWAAHQPDGQPAHTRGHGLAVIAGCMEQLHIECGAAGTTVILTGRPVPAGPAA
jgi:serine/threonine-protein kinase RsbW